LINHKGTKATKASRRKCINSKNRLLIYSLRDYLRVLRVFVVQHSGVTPTPYVLIAILERTDAPELRMRYGQQPDGHPACVARAAV
jgi:hypothetical protein